MKTIAIFSGYYLPHIGGIEIYTYNLAKELCSMGNKVIIITSRHDKNLKEVEEKDGVKIYRLPIYKIFQNRYPIIKQNKRCRDLLNMISNENLDTVIIQQRFWTTSYLATKIIRKNNIPACVIEHTSKHFTVNNKVLDKLGSIYEHTITNLIKRHIKDFYGVSKKCTEWLKHFNIQAKGIFYNSINIEENKKLEKYIKKSKDKIVITYVGRMIKEKGVLKLIKAFKKLQQKHSNIELKIAGAGPLLDKIQKENQYEKKIEILGEIPHDEVLKLLGKTTILVNPSSFPEGLPTTILEAGIMKCAVIATPMGGTEEIILDKKTGYICGFKTEEIFNKIEEAISDKNKMEEVSRNLYNTVVNQFSWKDTATKIVGEIKYKKD